MNGGLHVQDILIADSVFVLLCTFVCMGVRRTSRTNRFFEQIQFLPAHVDADELT